MTGFVARIRARRQSYGMLLCAVAAVLTFVGSFQTAFSVQFLVPVVDGSNRFAITSWGMQDNDAVQFNGTLTGFVAVHGIPLTVGAAVLLIAALFSVRIAPWARNARIARATRVLPLIGAAFLAGAVVGFGMQLRAWWRVWVDTVPLGTGLDVDGTFGPGFWLPAAAAVTAVVGAALAWRPEQPSTPREEPDTPVLGIPVVTRLPDEPPADPAT